MYTSSSSSKRSSSSIQYINIRFVQRVIFILFQGKEVDGIVNKYYYTHISALDTIWIKLKNYLKSFGLTALAYCDKEKKIKNYYLIKLKAMWNWRQVED